MAAAYNNIAYHADVPTKNWKEAEEHYRKSIELFEKAMNLIEAANVQINLLDLFLLSGRKVEADQVKNL